MEDFFTPMEWTWFWDHGMFLKTGLWGRSPWCTMPARSEVDSFQHFPTTGGDATIPYYPHSLIFSAFCQAEMGRGGLAGALHCRARPQESLKSWMGGVQTCRGHGCRVFLVTFSVRIISYLLLGQKKWSKVKKRLALCYSSCSFRFIFQLLLDGDLNLEPGSRSEPLATSPCGGPIGRTAVASSAPEYARDVEMTNKQ